QAVSVILIVCPGAMVSKVTKAISPPSDSALKPTRATLPADWAESDDRASKEAPAMIAAIVFFMIWTPEIDRLRQLNRENHSRFDPRSQRKRRAQKLH